MAVVTTPAAVISPSRKADGSATYSYAGYSITASVNGPIEAQRKDEDPNECVVDVVVRPESGVGGTRERQLEDLIEQTLRQVILIKNFPRALMQIVLQITTTPANDYANTKITQAQSNLSVLPALLQTTMLALLSASTPLRTFVTSAIIAITGSLPADITIDPSMSELRSARSLHVFAFTSDGNVLLAESKGDFSFVEWEYAHAKAQWVCCGAQKIRTDDAMDEDKALGENLGLQQFARSTAEVKVQADNSWR